MRNKKLFTYIEQRNYSRRNDTAFSIRLTDIKIRIYEKKADTEKRSGICLNIRFRKGD